MSVKISVIVPVYNVENYLDDCINSIINQSFNDIEIILVNDGSIDKSGSICDEFASKDKRIKVIHKENGGLSSARNVGLEIASGDYIGFVDSDDIISKKMYEILYKYIRLYNVDIAIGGVTNNKEELFNNDNIDKKLIVIENQDILKYYLKYDGHSVWKRLYRRNIFQDIRFEDKVINEDILASYQIMKKATSLVVIKEKLYFWNLEPASISRSPLVTIENQSEKVYKMIKAENVDKDLLIAAKIRALQFNYRNITKALRFGFRSKQVEEEYKESIKNYVNYFKRYYFYIINSTQFRTIDKVQISIICISYRIYSKVYSLLRKI